ncbi:hypothetical protein TUM20985_54660 [Mycobacterium antarcticum]|uniref:hypothetical protein n=1 Tax=Mycolicibacterium sp. TUM20985 TaxID=3023370 RepID=UPI00257471FB|nr:hypothetical protein [Mycolicibacterium sp. TUM20985]BDX34919.1 hypothetical protein TUM20985_54660 [Mycolicibacterium sp. TUM20985]
MRVPDDLIGHVIGPMPYSSWWFWVAVALTVALPAWYAAVVVATMPRRRLRGVPVLGATRDRLLRHRFARAVHAIGDRYRAGELGAAPTGEAVSRELRRFLREATGVPAEFMQLDDIATSEIGTAADVLADLIDVQFNAESEVDAGRVSQDAEELIRSWA